MEKGIKKEAARLLDTLGRYDDRRNEYFMIGFLSGSYKTTYAMMSAIVEKLEADK